MDIQKTALRLPKDLHQMVSDAARDAGHSMNAEIISRLRASFTHEEPKNIDLSELMRSLIREELARMSKAG